MHRTVKNIEAGHDRARTTQGLARHHLWGRPLYDPDTSICRQEGVVCFYRWLVAKRYKIGEIIHTRHRYFTCSARRVSAAALAVTRLAQRNHHHDQQRPIGRCCINDTGKQKREVALRTVVRLCGIEGTGRCFNSIDAGRSCRLVSVGDHLCTIDLVPVFALVARRAA